MARRLNTVGVTLGSYPHYIIMGGRKVGKTTLFADLVLYNYKDPMKGLLISCGDEDGYKAIDDLQVEDAKTWDMLEDEDGNRGLVQIVDELISLRGTKDQIEMVCLDTFDELVEIASKQVYEEHRNEKGKYPKSLNDALGGYGAGQRRVVELIKDIIRRLNQSGMAVFIIAHTKQKEVTDQMTDLKYEIVTNNLDSRFYSPIADTAQMVVNIVKERNIEGAGVEKKTIKGKEVEVKVAGKQKSIDRYMYFRENTYVDAGGRFEGLPERLPLSAENFMKAFEMGVTASKKKNNTEAEIKAQKKIEDKMNVEAGTKLKKKELVQKKKELAQSINQALVNNPTPEQLEVVAKKISDNNIKSFDIKDLEDIDVTVLEDIKNVFN